MSVLVLTQADVEALLTMRACIAVMRDTLAALARGEIHQPQRGVVRPPGAAGLMGLMPAYTAGSAGRPFYGLKAVCVFHGNPARGLDAHQGGVLLFSGETGELLALMNASAITAVRTAAVSAVATDLLARPEVGVLALVGAGVQARAHLEAMHCVRTLRQARIASRDPGHATRLAREAAPRYPFPVEPVATAEDAVRGADIVVTATTSQEPVVMREWIAPGAHLNVIGAYTPATREVDTATVAAARVFVDRREAALAEAGDVLVPIREGAITAEHIEAEIGEVLVGGWPGRAGADEITLFKSLGLSAEDLGAAAYLYRQALETEAGTLVDF